jgi:hypothetical protein
VTLLLRSLREACADQQVSTLLGRDPAGQADLSNPGGVASLLHRLRAVGADQQVKTLANHLPAMGLFHIFHEYFGSRFRFGREQDGRRAEPWYWDDLR